MSDGKDHETTADTPLAAPLLPVLIARQCSAQTLPAPCVVVLDRVASTNTWLAEHGADYPAFTVCAAERQTGGRGRRGKQWHTPQGGVTFSIQMDVPVAIADISGLSLALGAACCRVLRDRLQIDALVKWPNDIYWQHSKLAGILIEIANTHSHHTRVIAGIGINYRRGAEQSKIDQASTDLAVASGATLPERSSLIGALVAEVYRSTRNFGPSEIAALAASWSQYDALANIGVQVLAGQASASGTARGIDEQGRLQVETDTGLESFGSGEVSVRADCGR